MTPDSARIASATCSGAPATAGRRRRRRARGRCARRSCVDLAVGDPGRALDRRAELLGQRPERRPLLGRPRRSRARRRSAPASSGPGTGSHSPARQSRTSPRGCAISPGRVVQDRRRRRCRGARRGARRPARENARAIAPKQSQSVRASHGGGTAWLNECTNGCMSVIDRSYFSYQVAAGSTTSEYRPVVVIRKSTLTSRSSLPRGISSRQRTLGRALALGQRLGQRAVVGRRRAGGAGSTPGPCPRSRAGSSARRRTRAGSSPARSGPRPRSAAGPP